MLMRLLGTIGVFAAGVWVGRALRGAGAAQPEASGLPKVRDAGPDAMQQPPRRWDMVDEQADESFPASDPPGNY